MAPSGPRKAGRRSISGLDSLARRREENERLEVVWVAGWTQALRKEAFPGRGAVQYAASNLSWKLFGAGMPSFRPVCFHVSPTAWLGRLVWSKGSASRVWRCQEREGLAARVSPQVGHEAKGPSRQAWGCQPPGTLLRRGPASCSGPPRCHQALLRTSDLHRWRGPTGRGRRSARHRGSAGRGEALNGSTCSVK